MSPNEDAYTITYNQVITNNFQLKPTKLSAKIGNICMIIMDAVDFLKIN